MAGVSAPFEVIVARPGDPRIDTVANLKPGDVVRMQYQRHDIKGKWTHLAKTTFYDIPVTVESITDFPHKAMRMVWFTTTWAPNYAERFALAPSYYQVLQEVAS